MSDLAGVVVVTVLAAVVTGKPVRGGAVAAVGFAALKIVPGVAETAAPLLGGVTRRDATDLVALLVIPPTVRALGPWFDRTGLPRLAPPTGPIGSRRSGVLPRAVLAASGATVAVLAVSATSCLDTPTVTGLTVHDEVVWAEGHGLVAPGEQAGGGTSTRPEPSSTTGPEDGSDPEDPEPTDWARSGDGGWTWEPSDPPPSAGPAKRELDAATACANATGCFRIADG